jgi:hypothetical protein
LAEQWSMETVERLTHANIAVSCSPDQLFGF